MVLHLRRGSITLVDRARKGIFALRACALGMFALHDRETGAVTYTLYTMRRTNSVCVVFA